MTRDGPDHPTRDAGFGIYLHWPFCAAKCPYCDFNSHVRHAGVDEPRFLAAFRAEIAHAAARTPGRTVTSIFLGGGTPSLMQPATVAGLLDAVARPLAGGAGCRDHPGGQPVERRGRPLPRLPRRRGQPGLARASRRWTTPSLEASGPSARRRAGPRRRSGVAQAVFARTSFDLIYARPGQTPAAVAGRVAARRWRGPPSTCRSTSSPSSPARRSTAWPPPASW